MGSTWVASLLSLFHQGSVTGWDSALRHLFLPRRPLSSLVCPRSLLQWPRVLLPCRTPTGKLRTSPQGSDIRAYYWEQELHQWRFGGNCLAAMFSTLLDTPCQVSNKVDLSWCLFREEQGGNDESALLSAGELDKADLQSLQLVVCPLALQLRRKRALLARTRLCVSSYMQVSLT